MKISAIIYDAEREFSLINIGEEFWECRLVEDAESIATIRFTYDQGIVSDLQVHEDIETEPGIILERLLNVFREFHETQQMGFDREDDQGDQEYLDRPYDPEEIRVRAVVFSAFHVSMDIKKGKIDLDTDFQRNFVWTDAQKSLLIESMLLKIPLPAFYFSEDRTGRYQVIDGLQRLTVISQFLNNEFKLKNLQYLHHLEGRYYAEDPIKKIGAERALYGPYDSRVEGTMLNINIIEASSPVRVKYDIFYRINTGGRPLNRQEIRNCFATPRMRNFLRSMASDERFYMATGYSVSDTRMDAQELALRFCGFHLYADKYSGNMNNFLDNILEILNDVDDQELKELEHRYYISLANAYHLFGDYAFRKVLPEHLSPYSRKQFLNKAMFITWTNILAEYSTDEIFRYPMGDMASYLADELRRHPNLFAALTSGTTDRWNLEYLRMQFAMILQQYLDKA